MNNKVFGIALIVIGILIVAAVFLAGPLGLSGSSFGTKHFLGVAVGAVVFVVGVVLAAIKAPAPK